AARVSQVSGKVHVPLTKSPPSASRIEPENDTADPRGTTSGPAGPIWTFGAVLPVDGTSSSQTPRPCVATRRADPASKTRTSWTEEAGSPVPNRDQDAPRSVERKTPTSVPQ